jgi:hypothetical protein
MSLNDYRLRHSIKHKILIGIENIWSKNISIKNKIQNYQTEIVE